MNVAAAVMIGALKVHQLTNVGVVLATSKNFGHFFTEKRGGWEGEGEGGEVV